MEGKEKGRQGYRPCLKHIYTSCTLSQSGPGISSPEATASHSIQLIHSRSPRNTTRIKELTSRQAKI